MRKALVVGIDNYSQCPITFLNVFYGFNAYIKNIGKFCLSKSTINSLHFDI